jgi:hypothetical protein
MTEIQIRGTYRFAVASYQPEGPQPRQTIWSVGTVVEIGELVTLETIQGETGTVEPEHIIEPVKPVWIDKGELLDACRDARGFLDVWEVEKLGPGVHEVWPGEPGERHDGLTECVVSHGGDLIYFFLPEQYLQTKRTTQSRPR